VGIPSTIRLSFDSLLKRNLARKKGACKDWRLIHLSKPDLSQDGSDRTHVIIGEWVIADFAVFAMEPENVLRAAVQE
jgi:hypothetical protein